jgi:hypothetical protein
MPDYLWTNGDEPNGDWLNTNVRNQQVITWSSATNSGSPAIPPGGLTEWLSITKRIGQLRHDIDTNNIDAWNGSVWVCVAGPTHNAVRRVRSVSTVASGGWTAEASGWRIGPWSPLATIAIPSSYSAAPQRAALVTTTGTLNFVPHASGAYVGIELQCFLDGALHNNNQLNESIVLSNGARVMSQASVLATPAPGVVLTARARFQVYNNGLDPAVDQIVQVINMEV